MKKESNWVCHASDGLVGGDRDCDGDCSVVDCGHSIEHSQTRYMRLYQAIERKLTKRNVPAVVR